MYSIYIFFLYINLNYQLLCGMARPISVDLYWNLWLPYYSGRWQHKASAATSHTILGAWPSCEALITSQSLQPEPAHFSAGSTCYTKLWMRGNSEVSLQLKGLKVAGLFIAKHNSFSSVYFWQRIPTLVIIQESYRKQLIQLEPNQKTAVYKCNYWVL